MEKEVDGQEINSKLSQAGLMSLKREQRVARLHLREAYRH